MATRSVGGSRGRFAASGGRGIRQGGTEPALPLATRSTGGRSGEFVSVMPMRADTLPRPVAIPKPARPVRLARYIVSRRIPPKAANDNRHPLAGAFWQWAIAIALAPALTLAMMFSGLL